MWLFALDLNQRTILTIEKFQETNNDPEEIKKLKKDLYFWMKFFTTIFLGFIIPHIYDPSTKADGKTVVSLISLLILQNNKVVEKESSYHINRTIYFDYIKAMIKRFRKIIY